MCKDVRSLAAIVASAAVGFLVTGCASDDAGSEAMAPDDPSYAMVQADEYYYDEDGALLIPHVEPMAVTQQEKQAMVATCEAFTVTGVDILPNGRIGAIEFASIEGLGIPDGGMLECKALLVNSASNKVTLIVANDGQSCCSMKVENYNGVTRITCSGECDNGDACSLETTMEGEIHVFTCECPATP